MAPRDDVDDDPAVLDTLNRLVTSVDRELLANRLFDRDLASLSNSTSHDRNDRTDSYLTVNRCVAADTT